MNSGIRPNLIDLPVQPAPAARLRLLCRTSLYRRAKTNAGAGFYTVGNHFSRPANAPPQINRILEVSTCKIPAADAYARPAVERQQQYLHQFQQCLLYAFTGNVTGNRRLSDLREILSISSM